MARNDKEHTRRDTTSCGALAWRLRDGQAEVLLIKQFAHKDRWGVPKGHVNEGESFKDCAIREVSEETGVNVVLYDRLMNVNTNNRDERKTVITFLACVEGPDEPHQNDPDNEVADARWFSIDALPDLVIYQRPLVAEGIEVIKILTRNAPVQAITDL